MKKRTKKQKSFSMKWKLLLIFGVLSFIVGFTSIFVSVLIGRNVVYQQAEIQLKEKAIDTSKIINGRIQLFFERLNAIANMPFLRDENLSFQERAEKIYEMYHADEFMYMSFVDLQGLGYSYGTPPLHHLMLPIRTGF